MELQHTVSYSVEMENNAAVVHTQDSSIFVKRNDELINNASGVSWNFKQLSISHTNYNVNKTPMDFTEMKEQSFRHEKTNHSKFNKQ